MGVCGESGVLKDFIKNGEKFVKRNEFFFKAREHILEELGNSGFAYALSGGKGDIKIANRITNWIWFARAIEEL